MAIVYWSLALVGFMTAFVSVFVLCLCVHLIYIHNKYSHLPSPHRPSFFFGHLPSLDAYFKDDRTFNEYLLDAYKQCGPIYVVFFFNRPAVVVTDPLYIKKIYIDSHTVVPKNEAIYPKIGYIYGERALGYGLVTNSIPSSWARRRHTIGPAFHRQNLKNLMIPLNEVTDRLFMRLESCVRDCKKVGLLQELGNTTLDVIAQVAFGIDLEAVGDEHSPFRKATCRVFQAIEDNLRTPLPSWFLKVYQWGFLQSEIMQEQIKAVKFIRGFATKCISQRLEAVKGGSAPDDILSYIVKCAEKDSTITMEDLVDEFVTMFVAGHETTASSLAFTLFEVISNPDIEEKILEEVQEVIGSKGRVDFNDLPRLKYVGQCIMEGLRMYMVAGGPNRSLTEDIVVGSYKIPAGCSILANKYGINHSPSFWENPEEFNPDRFAFPEDIPNFRYVFFPFSLGPRNCIGQTFAMFEEKVMLARLIQKFKFKLLPGQTSKIEEKFTLAPKDGVRCTVEFR